MFKISSIFLTIILICNISISASAQRNISTLKIEDIMQGEKFTGYAPANINWSADGKNIYFDWNPEMKLIPEAYAYRLDSKKIEKLSIPELRNRFGTEGEYDAEHKFKVFSKNGDIYWMDLKANKILQITATTNGEFEPKFSADSKYILYKSDGNIFSWDKSNGTTKQLTNFIKGDKKRDLNLIKQDSYLEHQQLELFSVLRERKKIAKLNKDMRDSLVISSAKAVYYGEKTLTSLTIDPTMKIACYQLEQQAINKVVIVPDYVSGNGYTRDISVREKVGGTQSSYQFCVYDFKKDTVYQFDPKILKGIFNKPAYYVEYNRDSIYNPLWTEPRKVNYFGPVFSNDGKAILEIKSQDHKDRWLVLIDFNSDQKFTLLDTQHDDAWIGGPGIEEWVNVGGNIGWIDNDNIWYQSEATGYSHLYRQNVKTLEQKALTSGNFEILGVQLSNDKKSFYINSNKPSPFEHQYYKLSITGGEMQQITYTVGNNEVSLSPNEQYLAIRYSFSNKPWELYIMENKLGAEMKQLTHSTTKEFEAYNWRIPEIIHFTASDGVKVPARIYKPAKSNGAAVVFVHGAGYLQNVHRWWSSYFREFMFNNMLTDNGYTVLDIDYRASEGYGRDWRTAIYRHMGGRDLDDQVDGVKYLVDSIGINKKRIGMYGGSYGGFMTLMALFTKPGVFECGAALRSVTDWAHYNEEYTSNILNTPTEDSIAYMQSSPIYYANGLKDHLIMLHGMTDTNVNFQDVVRLSQRLIELQKNNWELAVFPVEDHGFKEASSWTDEYKRIYKLFDENLSLPSTPIRD